MQYMKQLLIEVDDEIAAKLEEVAPGRARRRSEFVRNAIRQALWEVEEAATAEAYQKRPDSPEEAYVDPDVWEARSRRKRPRR
jgi:predicted DNA-binding protein